MVNFLIKRFLKKEGDESSLYYKGNVAMLCSIVGIILNVILFFVKYIISIISGSVSISADAFNNITDAGTSIAMMFGIKIASYGSGEHHPAGHGRFEWIISSLMSFLVMNVGLKLLGDSIAEIGSKHPISISMPMLVIMLLSIGVKFYMYLYNKKYGREIDSEVMNAVSKDSISDAVATSMVLLSTLIYFFLGINVDGYCGILVSVFIIYNGFTVLCDTASRIIGSSPERSELTAIKKIVLEGGFFTQVMEVRIEDYGMGKEKVIIKAGYEEESTIDLQREMERIRTLLYEEKGYETILMPEKIIINEEVVSLEEEIRSKVKQIVPFSFIEHFYRVEAYEGNHYYVDVTIPKSQEKKEFEISQALEKIINETSGKGRIYPQYRIFHDVRDKIWASESRAKNYDSFMKERMFPKYFGGDIKKHQEILQSLLENIEHNKVLDVGCGSGDAAYILKADNDYLGMDISKSFLEIAKDKLRTAGFYKYECILGNACDIPAPNGSFDVVLCNLSMQMITPSILFVMEVKRVLKKDGIFIGSVPVIDFGKQRFRYNSDISTSKKLKALLEDKGFEVHMLEKVNGAVCYFSAIKR